MHDTTSDHPLYQNPSLRTMDVTLILSSLHGSATEQVTFFGIVYFSTQLCSASPISPLEC